MKRITININDLLYEKLIEIRINLMKDLRRNISFANILNSLAFSGLLHDFTEEEYKLIKTFMKNFTKTDLPKKLNEKKFIEGIRKVDAYDK